MMIGKHRVFSLKLMLVAMTASALVYAGSIFDSSPVSLDSGYQSGNGAAIEATEPPPDTPYSRFRHSDPQHQRMPCLLCHQRTDNSPRIKRTGHTPCAGCHVEQFAQTSGPICTICHTDTGTKAFPPLRSFNARFDHGRHLRQTNCATCHKPTRSGVALSIPRGAAAHNNCFSCHGPQTTIAGKNIGSCDTCHSVGRPPRTSEWAKAFGMNFSHREHARGKQSCSACHTVRAGAARGLQVSSPQPAMHFASPRAMSCASCHDGKKAFGANDFKNCKRCHEGTTFKF